jgi:hypothetical protein
LYLLIQYGSYSLTPNILQPRDRESGGNLTLLYHPDTNQTPTNCHFRLESFFAKEASKCEAKKCERKGTNYISRQKTGLSAIEGKQCI